jgi:hypothetical protein
VLQTSLEGLAEAQEHDYMCKSIHADRYAKDIKMCVALCKRIKEEEYSRLVGYRIDFESGEWFKMKYYSTMTGKELTTEQRGRLWEKENYLIQQDIDYLFKTLSKKLRKWWT